MGGQTLVWLNVETDYQTPVQIFSNLDLLGVGIKNSLLNLIFPKYVKYFGFKFSSVSNQIKNVLLPHCRTKNISVITANKY